MPNILAAFVVEYITIFIFFLGCCEEKERWHLGMQGMQKGGSRRCLGPWYHYRCYSQKHCETLERPGRILNQSFQL